MPFLTGFIQPILRELEDLPGFIIDGHNRRYGMTLAQKRN